MNTSDAAYAVAHESPGGCESLGPRMGISGALLRNKVNTKRSPENRNVLSLAESVRMTDLTGDDRILEAWAQERGYVLTKIPMPENCSDGEVIELMAKTWETHGEIGREVIRTFEDGRVERHEVIRVRASAWKHIKMLLGLVGHIEGMAE